MESTGSSKKHSHLAYTQLQPHPTLVLLAQGPSRRLCCLHPQRIPSQPQSSIRFASPVPPSHSPQAVLLVQGNSGRHFHFCLEIFKRLYFWLQLLLGAVYELSCWQRDQAEDTSAPQEILKGPYVGFQLLCHNQKQSSPPRYLVETHPFMSPEPGLQTAVMTMDPETAQGLGSSPCQPGYRTSPAHSGTCSVTRQQPSQDPVGATPTVHLVIILLTEDPKVNFYLSATLLSKVLKVVPFTQGLDRIHA